MPVSTTDPITGNDVPDPEHHPCVVEGKGENAIKTHFETGQNRQEYRDIVVEHPGNAIEPVSGDNRHTGGIRLRGQRLGVTDRDRRGGPCDNLQGAAA